MTSKLPRLDKTRLTMSAINDNSEEKRYWLSQSAAERLNAIEIQRKLVYGEVRATSRLQRLLEISELK